MPIEERYICNGNKYTFRDGTITLPASLDNLPKQIEVEGCKLTLKSNFHVSLVCVEKIMEKHRISIPDFENLVIKDFCDFIKNNDFSLIRYRDEFRFATENEKKSIVVMAEVSNIDKFFNILNKKYGLKAEVQPTHVTLYTLQPDIGIFITDSKDLEHLTKTIKSPIGLPLDFD
ncbi:MAG: hypothetical protein PHH21_02840 [Candidatus Pacebacteria bacterium]|nr:hypothetical protein [Candidatus Paceibacterota bacterium]